MDRKDKIIINGDEFSFKHGETIFQVAKRNGIDIPTLCYIKGSNPTGACRICVVEVKGARNLLPSCATPVSPNMIAETESERVIKSRKLNLELLLASGHHNCITCEKNGDCRLPIPGEVVEEQYDTIFAAIGQVSETSFTKDLAVRKGWIAVDRCTLATNLGSVYAGGDAVTGPAMAVDALAAGKRAAISIDREFSERRGD